MVNGSGFSIVDQISLTLPNACNPPSFVVVQRFGPTPATTRRACPAAHHAARWSYPSALVTTPAVALKCPPPSHNAHHIRSNSSRHAYRGGVGVSGEMACSPTMVGGSGGTPVRGSMVRSYSGMARETFAA